MTSGIIVCAIFATGILIGLPIAFILLLGGGVGLALLRGSGVAFASLSAMPYAKLSDAGLLVIPLFILMGYLASRAGVSEKAYDVAYKLVGHFRAGLAIATVFACAGFAATSGSSVATSAAVGRIALGEMKRFRYSETISAGVVASAGLLGIMIPPSIMLVIYGIVTETNIGKLLIAGIFPGILTALVFSVGLYVIALWKPHLMPVSGQRLPLRTRIVALKDLRGLSLLIISIIGGIYTGIFTITEAAGIGAFVALVMALIKTRGRLSDIANDGLETARVCTMMFLILIGAGLFSQYVALSGTATGLATAITTSGLDRYSVLFLVLLAYIPLGMFLEPISMCLITLPIIFPSIRALGFDPIWFGVIIVKMCELANITPPVGVNVFVIRGIDPSIPLSRVFRGAAIFVVLEIITLGLLIGFPKIATWLPQLMIE